MDRINQTAKEHYRVTRRYFLQLSSMGIALPNISTLYAQSDEAEIHSLVAEAVSKLEYLTRDEDFINFGRGKPPPHTLSSEKLLEAGLTPESWRLEVLADPESNAEVERPLSKELGTALDWDGFMKMAEKKAVRFMSVVSCTNVKEPCGMGLWEGVPLREVIWLARPVGNIRRVFYYGFHNDDPEQRFQGSLPIGRVLEDPPGEEPVILCYKLNGAFLSLKRGGPVRILAPDVYGNKSVKWVQRIFLTNNFLANDTYALWNNDTASSLKTNARFIHVPESVKAVEGSAITGVAQVGMSGLSKVQYWLCPKDQTLSADDPYFNDAPWRDADILPQPDNWGGGLPDGELPSIPSQFDSKSGKALRWPLRNAIVHWAALLAVDEPGEYDLRCRTIDANGVAQPM
ncbi:molybdopterin-dependent oxidoreductase, partial [candidate division KSB1 bacterium]